MSRRRALALGAAGFAGAAGIMAFGGLVISVQARSPDHDYDGFAHGTRHRHGPDSQHQALVDAASRCVAAGKACLARGSSADLVAVMMAACGPVARAPRFETELFEDAVALAASACADCGRVCLACGDRDANLRICADASFAFVKESQKLVQA